MSVSQHYRLAEPDVVWECVDGEAVLIDFRTGCYFSVAQTGADVLRLLLAGYNVAAAGECLATAFDRSLAEVTAEVEAFTAQLVAEGILLPVHLALASPGPMALESRAYSTPVWEKFNDMADQLLLDPIHEIPTQGWPVRDAA